MRDNIKEALVDYELRFHALFEQTHDAVFLLDFEGNHLEVNQRACEMFGYTKGEMLKLSYKDVSMNVDSSRDNLDVLMREGILPIYESHFRKKDGSTISVEVNAVLVKSREDKPLFIQSALRDISARKRAENEHMKRIENEKKLRSIFESSPVGLAHYNQEGTIMDCNQQLAEILGVKKEKLLGLNVLENLSNKQMKVALEKAIDGEKTYFENYYNPIIDTDERYFKVKFNPISSHKVPTDVIATIEDMTSQKKSEEKLEALSQFQAIMMNMAIGFVNLKEDQLDEAIDRTLKMVGQMYNIDRAYLLRIDENNELKLTNEWSDSVVIRPEDTKKINRISLPLTREESCLGEVGFEIYIEDKKWQDESTTLLNVLAILLTNVIEKQIHENEMIMAKTEAQVANEVKGNFLANMSHEFRTPLNGVIGMMGLLRKTTLDQKQKDYLDKALEFSRLLLHTLNDILDFSKIEAGMLTLEKTRFELHKIIEDVNAIVSPTIFNKGLSLTVTIPKNVPESLIGDSVRIRQILINLMSNAVKFTDQGKVGVKVEMGKAIDSDRSWFSFEIMDTGIGMNQSQIEHIFSPFVQADSSVTRRYGGTGLGLAIVKDLVRLMEGTISLESKPGEGSVFNVMIPLEFIQDDALNAWKFDEYSSDTDKRTAFIPPLRRHSDPETSQIQKKEDLLSNLIETLIAHKPKQSMENLGKLEVYLLRMEDQDAMSRIKTYIKNYKFDEALHESISLKERNF